MTRRHRGLHKHCRTIRNFTPHYAKLPQATQWPDGRTKHTRQWLGCVNSIPRYVFQILTMCWALTSMPKILRDTQKDCGEPDCPNDHRSQVFSRGDEVIEQSG